MFMVDLFYPKFCLGCGRVGSYICLKCRNKLAYLKRDSCIYCGEPALLGLTHGKCRQKYGVDGTLSIFRYNNFIKRLIKTFKYRLIKSVWREISLSIDPEEIFKINFFKKQGLKNNLSLQPIPLTQNKYRQRGFNQAQIISEFFQTFLRLPIVDCLQRIKETKPQAQIKTDEERKENLKNAFCIKDEETVTKKNFILVDDLWTTGSTILEASLVLKKAGAKKVYGLTLAKG